MRETLIAVGVAVAIAVPVFGVSGKSIFGQWESKRAAERMIAERGTAYERLVSLEALPQLSVEAAAHGRDLFATTCAACHGAQGQGVPGLGKNLVESDFVASLGDKGLREFIIAGRPDAKPVPMPPRAGRDDLSDGDIDDVVAFVRGLQDPRRMPALPEAVVAAPSEADAAAALEAAGGDEELAAYIASGDKIYHASCMACHGKAGVGIKGNGKALANSEFVQDLDDDALLAFIMQGRTSTDPKNTTGIQMPPKGGNPALSEDDILDVISYLRTLQTSGAGVSAGK